jgi:hypothetical protein
MLRVLTQAVPAREEIKEEFGLKADTAVYPLFFPLIPNGNLPVTRLSGLRPMDVTC